MADGLEPIGEVNLQMASAYVAWNAGSDLAGASRHLELAAEAAERLPPTIERDHVRAAAGALFHRAELSCLRGDPAAALHTLGYVRKLLDRLPYKPSELLGRLFLELSVVHALVVGGMPRSVEYALEALDVFEFERHAEGIAVASGLLCVALTECGEFEPAFALGTMALETARSRRKSQGDCGLRARARAGARARWRSPDRFDAGARSCDAWGNRALWRPRAAGDGGSAFGVGRS